jgi:hypothetical protein
MKLVFNPTLTVSKVGEGHLENSPNAHVYHRLMPMLGSFPCISCGPDEMLI